MDSVMLQCAQLEVHPLIKRFVKGVFNVKPPTRSCTLTWDIKKVLNYMNQLPVNEELSMKLLSEKIAMLLLLLGGERINSLTTFSVESTQLTTTECTFIPFKLLKHSRPGYVYRLVTYKNCPQNIKLCLVRLITEYIKRINNLLQSDTSVNSLFITY